MANLITEKQKKLIKIDYLMRLFSLSLIMPSALLGIFLLAYVIPYYLSINKKDQIVAGQFTAVLNAENRENVGESTTQLMGRTTEEIKALEFYNTKSLMPLDYFNKIIGNKNPNISLSKMSVYSVKVGEIQIVISGVSKNREGLVLFIQDLKSKAGFASVTSPISDFAKNMDISFTININSPI
jgi:hypothetical protein